VVGATGALAVAVVVAVTWLLTRPEPSARSSFAPGGKASACRSDQLEDPARAHRVEALLRSTAEGRRLLESQPAPVPICFASGDASALVNGGPALLDRAASDGENAARLGHLLLHATERMPFSGALDPRRPCAALVEEAVRAEARAHALELELRRALRVTAPRRRYDFEADYFATSPERRLELLADRLRAAPDGLARAYAERCAQLRAAGGRGR